MNEVVVFYQLRPPVHPAGVALAARQDSLEAFARAHQLQVFQSFSGPEGGDAFTRAVALARALGGLLLVTSDPGDERDIRLMVNLTRQGVRFMAVNIEKSNTEKSRPRPWPERH